jgi:hypothetical protein
MPVTVYKDCKSCCLCSGPGTGPDAVPKLFAAFANGTGVYAQLNNKGYFINWLPSFPPPGVYPSVWQQTDLDAPLHSVTTIDGTTYYFSLMMSCFLVPFPVLPNACSGNLRNAFGPGDCPGFVATLPCMRFQFLLSANQDGSGAVLQGQPVVCPDAASTIIPISFIYKNMDPLQTNFNHVDIIVTK